MPVTFDAPPGGVCLPTTMDGRTDIKQRTDRIGDPKAIHPRHTHRGRIQYLFTIFYEVLFICILGNTISKRIESRPCNFVSPSLSVNYSPFPSKDCPLREIENFPPSRPEKSSGWRVRSFVRLSPGYGQPVLLRRRNYKFGKPRSFPSTMGRPLVWTGLATCVSRNLAPKSQVIPYASLFLFLYRPPPD